MGTTAGQHNNQTPYPGTLFLGASCFVGATANTGTTFVNNSKGNNSWHLAASSSGKFFADIASILRLPYQPNEQLQFQQNKVVDGTPVGIPPIASVGGKPPIYSPLTVPQGKGLAILSAQVFFKIGAVNLTSGSIGVSKAVFPADNTAANPTVTDIIAPTTLALVQRANLYNSLFNSTDQGMLVLANTQVQVEVDAVTPAGGTFDFFGVQLNLNYNYA